jgi:hypothetical protein
MFAQVAIVHMYTSQICWYSKYENKKSWAPFSCLRRLIVVIFGDFVGFFRFIRQQICDRMLSYLNDEISPQKIKKHCLQANLFQK